MNADNSARLRDLLPNNRTLRGYIRTARSFAGLGHAVAKFGLNPKTMHVSGFLGDLHGPHRVPKGRLTGGIGGIRLGGRVNALARPTSNGAAFSCRRTAQGGAAVRDPG